MQYQDTYMNFGILAGRQLGVTIVGVLLVLRSLLNNVSNILSNQIGPQTQTCFGWCR